MKATEFLQAAIDTQAERGKQYDSPEGERSMGRTVQAFNAITGRDLTEAEGWLLLQVLKDVRQWQNPDKYHHDSALDGVAYASLKAEALSGDYSAPAQATMPEGWTDIRAPHPPFGIGDRLELLMVNGTTRVAVYGPGMIFPDVQAWRFVPGLPAKWIEHDGRPCPLDLVGKSIYLRRHHGGEDGPHQVPSNWPNGGNDWVWQKPGEYTISEYRLA